MCPGQALDVQQRGQGGRPVGTEGERLSMAADTGAGWVYCRVGPKQAPDVGGGGCWAVVMGGLEPPQMRRSLY